MNEHHQPFEEIRHYGTEGQEFWSAENWHRYWIIGTGAIFKGTGPRDSSVRSQQSSGASDHFVETTKMVVLGSGLNENLKMFISPAMPVTPVVQNGDPAKPVIAAGQTYFAIQTRRQELADDEAFRQLREDEKRLFSEK